MPHWPIPDIPGELLQDDITRGHLVERVSQLCHLTSNKFPGSQPVSFTLQSLDMLETKDFWVCEKSDGVRVLVLIVMNGMTGNQEVWLIDRKQRFFSVSDLHFPHWEKQDDPLTDTILDGELVIDIDPKTQVETLRFYAFDCLVLHGDNIMKKDLKSRFGRLKTWVVEPFKRALNNIPEWRETLPFEFIAKEQELSYHINQVLNVHIPSLRHGHDGLIFTCAESEYVPGTDEKILKWKPPSENSVDFRLELRFPPSSEDPSQPDLYAKPAFLLNTWLGNDRYEYFDQMDVEDLEWEDMKHTEDQLDDRIVEVCWDAERGTWRMLRFRDDKPHANHKSIMEKILVSIEDGVEIDVLISRSESIRATWKAREAAKAGHRPPPQQAPVRRPTAPAHPPTPGGMGGPGAPGPVTPGTAYPSASTGIMAGLRR